jgi:hypothetical protein
MPFSAFVWHLSFFYGLHIPQSVSLSLFSLFFVVVPLHFFCITQCIGAHYIDINSAIFSFSLLCYMIWNVIKENPIDTIVALAWINNNFHWSLLALSLACSFAVQFLLWIISNIIYNYRPTLPWTHAKKSVWVFFDILVKCIGELHGNASAFYVRRWQNWENGSKFEVGNF